MNSTEQRQKHAKLITDARQIQDTADSEKREVTAEDAQKFDRIMADAAECEAQYTRLEKLESVESMLKESQGRISQPEKPTIDLPKETKQCYSILRAIRKLTNKEELDGLEREVSDEIALKSGKNPQGFYIPTSIAMDTMDMYALDSTTGTGAVGTFTDPSSFVELLRNRMVVQQLGATVLDGLTSSLSIPKQTGTTTAAWVAEGAATSASNATIGQVALAPKSVTAFTDLSRKFILQSSVSAEQFARDDIAKTIALEIDRAAINGSGSGAEPLGILQNSGVPIVDLDGTDGGAPTYAAVIQMETEVAQDNADVGNLAYLTNAKGRGKMKVTEKVSGQPVYLWNDTSEPLNGYRALVSNQVPSDLTQGVSSNLSGMIFGNWADLLIGMWGGLDILVDPYTGSSTGTVRIVLFQDVDIKLRHDESFSRIIDMITV